MRKDFSVDHSIDWGALTEQADTVLPPVASQDQGQQGQQQQKGPAWESQLAGEEQEAKLAGGDRLTDMQQQEQDEQEDETAMHRPRWV
jgi:nitrate reductase beta subunit